MGIYLGKECILIYNYYTDTINYLNNLKKDFETLNIVAYEKFLYVQADRSKMYDLLYAISNDLCEDIERIE